MEPAPRLQRIWGSDSIPVSARAVARPDILSILTLYSNATRGLDLVGSVLNVPGKVIIDSTTSTALGDSVGGGSVTAQKIDVVGTNSPGQWHRQPDPHYRRLANGRPACLPAVALVPDRTAEPTAHRLQHRHLQFTSRAASSTIYPGLCQNHGPQQFHGHHEPGSLLPDRRRHYPFTMHTGTGTLTGNGVLIYNGQLNGHPHATRPWWAGSRSPALPR